MDRSRLPLLAALVILILPASASALTDPYATAPETTIDSGPSGPTASGRPTFDFSSSHAGSLFGCQIDDEAYRFCTSPYTSEPLTQGPHIFRVVAVDPAGLADPSPAVRSFVVDRSISGANVSAKHTQRLGGGKVGLKVIVRATETVTVTARGSVLVGGESIRLDTPKRKLVNGANRVLILAPASRSGGRRILNALASAKTLSAHLTATFVDDVGNRATSGSVAVTLKGK